MMRKRAKIRLTLGLVLAMVGLLSMAPLFAGFGVSRADSAEPDATAPGGNDADLPPGLAEALAQALQDEPPDDDPPAPNGATFRSGNSLTIGQAGYGQVKLLPPSPSTGGDGFGSVVAVDGSTAVVGAWRDGPGTVYLFEYTAGNWSQKAKLRPADGEGEDRFGFTVAISGDTIVVGSGEHFVQPSGPFYSGSAYVFEKGSGWSDGHANQVAKLEPDDRDDGDTFGGAVAVSGDTVIIGASTDGNPNGANAGSAYVFQKGSDWSDGNANQVAKLDPQDGDTGDNFGWAVAISGETVIVGAKDDEHTNGDNAGSAYVFEKGSGWSDGHANQVAKLDPDDGDSKDIFGQSVSISGDTLVVGAGNDEDPNGEYYSGSAYVFEKAGGWSNGHANQVAKLDPDDGDPADYFGSAVAVSDDTALVGAFNDERGGESNVSGSAYVFEKGGGWSDGDANQVVKLLPDGGQATAYKSLFGYALAISGDTAVVGAPEDGLNGPESGSVHVFEYTAGSWLHQAKLDPDDGDSYDKFGNVVAIDGDTIVVGAGHDEDPNGNLAGSAYVFEKDSGWGDGHANQVAKLDPQDGGDGDYFGDSVAISGETVIVGAAADADPNGVKSGSAYVFEKSMGWSDGHANQVAKLDPDDGADYTLFGVSAVIKGVTVVIGAAGPECGSAYVFEKGSGWMDGHANQVANLYPDDWCIGYPSLAMNDTTVVIGNPDAAPNGYYSGAAHVFEKGSGWSDDHANHVATLDPDDGEGGFLTGDYFGQAVAISGDTIIVGAPGDNTSSGEDAGSAYVFEKGTGWSDGHANQVASLKAQDGDAYDRFGSAVAIVGDTIVAGAPYDEEAAFDAGAAYVITPGGTFNVYLPMIIRQ